VNAYAFNAVGDSVRALRLPGQLFRKANVFENNLNVVGRHRADAVLHRRVVDGEERGSRAHRRDAQDGRAQPHAADLPDAAARGGANFINNRATCCPNGETNGITPRFIFNPDDDELRPVNRRVPDGTIVNPLLAIERFRYPQETNAFLGNLAAPLDPLVEPERGLHVG
jgi:hypothetical protein